MQALVLEQIQSMNIAIFDLAAVVRYDHLSLRKCLVSALREVLGEEAQTQDIDWNGNCSGVLMDVFKNTIDRFPNDDEYQRVTKSFRNCLKQYFVESEESFDVWPGVQNIFQSLSKKKNWEFFIVSDYWFKGTKFILDSCGIYSKKLNLYTADDALSAADNINRIISKHKKGKKDRLYLLNNEVRKKELDFSKKKIERIKMPFRKKSKKVEYPRFSKLFIE